MKKLAMIITAIAIVFTTAISKAQVGVGVSITVGPPAIPVYVQPPCPVDGYLWVPGYWAWDPDEGDYYWVPGYWMDPPEVGFLWTPGYWGFADGAYLWYPGYWGPTIGFYGGVCYGFGYYGHGFYGGRWEDGHFRYNTAAWTVNNTVIHNTYVERGDFHHPSGASFNGRGGVTATPTHEEEVARNEHHTGPTSTQVSHERNMRQDKSQFAKVNNGRPSVAAMDKPGGQRFNSRGKEATAAPHAIAPARTSAPSHSKTPSRSQTPSHTQTHIQQQNHQQTRPQIPRQQAPQQHSQPPARHEQPRQAAPRQQAPQQHMRPPVQHEQPRQMSPPRQQAPPRQAPPPRMSQPPMRQQPPMHNPPPPHREGERR